MNYNPDPKSEFVKNEANCKAHRAVIESVACQIGLEVAMMTMQRRAADQTPADNFNACASSHLRMLGAQEFMDVFLNLAETAVAAPRTDSTNLPSNVRSMPQPRKN